MSRFGDALRHAWNVFTYQQQRTLGPSTDYYGPSRGTRSTSSSVRFTNGKSIIPSIYTRIGVDVSSVEMRHVRTDEEKRYLEDIDSGLNSCLTLEANMDQAATAFRRDIVMTMMEEGCAVIVPVDTSISPNQTGGYDIQTMRVGTVVQWHPEHVRISLYNEKTMNREEVTLRKDAVAIVENPLYSVMNEPNSILQRLMNKLNLLDSVDEASASGKLDLIIQLPYVIKSEARRQSAEQRRKDIEFQLKGSQYGIAYTDGTEKITQLNRPAENNLMTQIEYLTKMLYGQLGITEDIMNGTADEKTMLNYWNRTVEPMLTAIVESMRPRFLTKTARTQKQWIMFFRDPFRLVPIENIAEIADKFTRNEIMTSNEFRQVVGMKPSKEKKADQLVNANMPQTDTGVPPTGEPPPEDTGGGVAEMGSIFDEMDGIINDALSGLTSNGSGG